MRQSRGGNRVRKTKELPVVEFALILWLFFIFILVVIQANHHRQLSFIEVEVSGAGDRDGVMYRSHRSSPCVPLLNLISPLQQVVQESVQCPKPNATYTITLVHKPVSLNRQAGSGLIVRVTCQPPGDLGEVC